MPAGAAIRGVRRLVRDDGLDVDTQVPDPVRAEQVRDRVVRQHDAPRVVGAEVEPDAVADAEHGPVATRGERDVVDLMTGVGRARHVLAPVLDPLHGAAEDHGRDRDQRVLRISLSLGAETAAEIGRDDADLVRRQAERGRQALLDEVGHLGRVPRRQGAGAPVPRRDHAACLDRHPDVALDRERLVHDDVGRGERGIDVADGVTEADGDVRAPFGMHERAGGRRRRAHVDDRGQRLPVDVDALHGVFGAGATARHDHRDDLAGIARAVPAQGVLLGHVQLEAHRGGEAGRRRAEHRQRLHEAFEITEREDAHDVGHGGRRLGAHGADPGMGVRRAEKRDVEHPGEDHVVDVTAVAAEEAGIFAAPDGRPEVLRAHAGATASSGPGRSSRGSGPPPA
jgi:hypothetical protein